MDEDRTLYEVENPTVVEIAVDCGCCGVSFSISEIEDQAVALEEMFGDCPHCGEGYDASKVHLMAGIGRADQVQRLIAAALASLEAVKFEEGGRGETVVHIDDVRRVLGGAK